MKLSSRDRRVLILGGIGVLLIGAAHTILLPWLDSWHTARDGIATYRQELKQIQSKLGRLVELRARLVPVYGAAVGKPPAPVDTIQVHFPRTIQSALKTGGFVVKNIRKQPQRTSGELRAAVLVPFEVKGSCQTAQLAKSLAELNRAETLILVDRLDVTNNEQKPGQLEVTMVLSTLAKDPRKP